MKYVWNLTKALRSKKNQFPPINSHPRPACTKQEKLQVFGDHLTETFTTNPTTNQVCEAQTINTVTEHLNRPPNTRTRPCSAPEIKWPIKHLKDRKAPGPDNIQNIVLKHTPDIAITYLTGLINAMFTHGYFPRPGNKETYYSSQNMARIITNLPATGPSRCSAP